MKYNLALIYERDKEPKEWIDYFKDPSMENYIITFPEFLGEVDDVLQYVEKIRSFCKTYKSDVLITPENFYAWELLKEELSHYNIIIPNYDVPREYRPESIALWFDRNGKLYVFPKLKENHRVHKLSERDIGIVICGEILYIKPEDLEGVKLLLNPALENDDLYIRGRTLKMYGVPQEDILEFYKWLTYKPLGDEEFNLLLEGKELKREVSEEKIKEVLNELKRLSGYLSSIYTPERKHKLPLIIRADKDKSTGILYLLESTRLSHLEYNDKEGYCKMSLSQSSN